MVIIIDSIVVISCPSCLVAEIGTGVGGRWQIRSSGNSPFCMPGVITHIESIIVCFFSVFFAFLWFTSAQLLI